MSGPFCPACGLEAWLTLTAGRVAMADLYDKPGFPWDQDWQAYCECGHTFTVRAVVQ